MRAIAALQALQPKVYNRQLVLFDANHAEDPAGAVRLAETELAVRKDVYGWDADAWALLAAGRAGDADAAMQKALALGTNDALLLYHAGMIAHGVGDDGRARSLLERALALNPGFDPLQAVRARQGARGHAVGSPAARGPSGTLAAVRERETSGDRGWFITVEGPDGAGKTLVAGRLRDALVEARDRRPGDPRAGRHRASANASAGSSSTTSRTTRRSIRARTRSCSAPPGRSSSRR